MTLTNKQAAFVDEYLIDFNATQAAIRAGYSKKTANEQGSQNLAKLNIQKAIQKAITARQKANGVTRDSIASEIDDMTAVAKQQATEGNTQALSAWVKAIEAKAKLYGFYDTPPEPEPEQGNDEIIVTVVDARKTPEEQTTL